MLGIPFIPRTITVHLGAPTVAAENVYVPFPDYIKNVASSEIYPTWPEASLRANIYAQISYALNRYYTEWYPSQGYNFDITNTTQFDQSFVPEREIYDSISIIVDEIFNSYVVKGMGVEPYFTQYCNGVTNTCRGMSQWGTVGLAQQGYDALSILRQYYGEDVRIVENAPIRNGLPSYPGKPLREGVAGNDVQQKQIQLNRISSNFPAIPKIYPTDGIFGAETTAAVKAFQKIFTLSADGIIGPITWNKLSYLYTSVKRLSELDSEGVLVDELAKQYSQQLSIGMSNNEVRVIQYYLNVIGAYYDAIPQISVTGNFDEETDIAVKSFQQLFGLDVDGIVGRNTWQAITNIYESIRQSNNYIEGGVPLFPGRVLRIGSQGEDVAQVQEFLSYISTVYTEIQSPSITGIFGQETRNAVIEFQQLFGLEDTGGAVGPVTWNALATEYSALKQGNEKRPAQYPGYHLAPASQQ